MPDILHPRPGSLSTGWGGEGGSGDTEAGFIGLGSETQGRKRKKRWWPGGWVLRFLGYGLESPKSGGGAGEGSLWKGSSLPLQGQSTGTQHYQEERLVCRVSCGSQGKAAPGEGGAVPPSSTGTSSLQRGCGVSTQ